MDADPGRAARRRAERIALFRAELAELQREQGLVLTEPQQSHLDAHLQRVLADLSQHYAIDVAESAKRISWGIRVATLLGGVAFGIAAVLFLHRFWGSLAMPAQVSVLVAAPLLLLAGAEWMYCRRIDAYYMALVGLAAAVAFIVELNALGTVMNLAPSPHALLVWALFGLLVAYAYGLRLLLGAGLFLACGYTAAVWIAAEGGHWASVLDGRPELLIPAAVVLYGVPWVMPHRELHDFGFVYRLCGALAGLTALLIFSTSGHLCCWGVSLRIAEVSCQIAGMVLSAGVIFHGFGLGRGGLVTVGAAAFVLFLYVRLHSWWWHWMPKYLFFFLIGLTAVGLLLIFMRLRKRLAGKAIP